MEDGKQFFVISYLEDNEWLDFTEAPGTPCIDMDDAYPKAVAMIEKEFKSKAVKCDQSRRAENVIVADGVEYKVAMTG
jgi:hypothetical protein